MMVRKLGRLRFPLIAMVIALLGGCSDARPASGARLAVPQKKFSGFVETVAVRSTLKGIEVFETEACPWIEDHVLLVFSKDASVDASGPVLISKDHRIAVGDDFESAPLVRLQGGFECGGKHWTQAAHLPEAPQSVG